MAITGTMFLPNICRRLSFWFLILASVGCLAQVIQVSTEYFRYKTATQISMHVRQEFPLPTLSFCVRYADVVDAERVKRETGKKWRQVLTVEDAREQESLLTIREIFMYSPQPEQVLTQCMYRDNVTFEVCFTTADECLRYFFIQKFLHLETVCYSIGVRKASIVERRHFTQASFSRGTINFLFFPHNLTSPHFDFVLHERRVPYASRDFSSNSDDYSYSDGFLYFLIASVKRTVNALRAPYDTRCVPLDEDAQFLCRRQCLMQRFEGLARAPCTEVMDEPIDRPCLGALDRRNATIRSLVNQAHDDCSRSCNRIPCHSSIFLTKHRSYRSANLTANRMAIVTANEADVVVTSVQSMCFIEFFSFITGCFGFWFGASFLSLTRVASLCHLRRLHAKTASAAESKEQLDTGCKRPARLSLAFAGSASIEAGKGEQA